MILKKWGDRRVRQRDICRGGRLRDKTLYHPDKTKAIQAAKQSVFVITFAFLNDIFGR